MNNEEFSQIRQFLGKTQEELAHLLCVSPKAIQSFEQGWRNIPPSAERQLLFLLSLKRSSSKNIYPCWKTLDCPDEWKKNCMAWELGAGYFCWFINGTCCQGEFHENWAKKIDLCRKCKVFQALLPLLGD